MAWLVPEIIAEVHACRVGFPTPDNIEILVEVEVAARGVAIGITQHRYDDIGAEAMNRMRCGQICFLFDFFTVNGFENGWLPWVCCGVDNVEI